MSAGLRPFWRYYGAKWRSAPLYPAPTRPAIVEPFAGAAGYSLRYPDMDVTLVDAYPVIAEVWRYLIGASAAEIRRIPETDDVASLPASLPQGARWLVGFCMNASAATPRRTLSSGCRKLRAAGRRFEGWCAARRELVAGQVGAIRHWRVIEGDYTTSPDLEATWFVDPPYQVGGEHYARRFTGHAALGDWCRARRGQVIVCEGYGAKWLPFKRLATVKSGPATRAFTEALWTNARAARRRAVGS